MDVRDARDDLEEFTIAAADVENMFLSENVTIDLDTIGNPNVDPSVNDFIQQEARQRLLRALAKTVHAPADEEAGGLRPTALNVLRERRHDAILVSARRGEGKTTFLTRILAEIEKYKDWKDLLGSTQGLKDPPRLYSLGLIDPTLIETKQNIMIVVIDRIRIATQHKRKHNGADEGYKAVDRALHKLAEGLSLLDGIGGDLYSGKDWLDPEYVLERGLEEASAAHDFERRFRNYVKVAADFLNVNAFVLAIDDVDTWFERGWPVLEAMRKYLATPQVRIILSGDLNLYALLVRQQQWAQMRKEFLNAEKMLEKANGTSQIREIGAMVGTLQDQYLVKVAPPESRINLRPLGSQPPGRKITLKWGDPTTEATLENFVQLLSERVLGIRQKSDTDLIRQKLLQLPLRSALQILAGARLACSASHSSFDEAQSQAEDALRHVAWTALMNLGLDVDKTRDAVPDQILGILSEWLTRRKLWESLARLYPDAVDADDRNLVAIYLTAILNGFFVKSPGKMIDYWLKISTVREKIDRGEISASSDEGVPQLLKHLAADTSESSYQFVSRLASWEAIEGGKEGTRQIVADIRFSGATVPMKRIREWKAAIKELYGFDFENSNDAKVTLSNFVNGRSKGGGGSLPPALKGYHERLKAAGFDYQSYRATKGIKLYYINGLEDLSDNLDRNARLIAHLPIHEIISGQASGQGNFSFLRILAVVGEMIDLMEKPSEDREFSLSEILRSAGMMRSYPTPVAVEGLRLGITDGSDLEVDGDPLDDADLDGIKIETVLAKWLENHSGKEGQRHTLAPIVLSRVWTRFTYSFQKIREGMVHGESRYLGVLTHRMLISFLHSVGYEVLRAANVDVSASLANNPVTSGEFFVRLLDEIYDEKHDSGFHRTAEFAFFDLIFTCPLWGYFLARREQDEVTQPRRLSPNESIFAQYSKRTDKYWLEDEIAVVTLRSPGNSEDATFEGLYFLLNTVQLQGQDSSLGRQPNAAKKRRVQLSDVPAEDNPTSAAPDESTA